MRAWEGRPCPVLHGVLKLLPAGFVVDMLWIGTGESREGARHEPDRPDYHRLCGAVADDLRRNTPGVFERRFAAPMRDGRAALYRTVGRRAPEMDRREMALRISAQQRQGGCVNR